MHVHNGDLQLLMRRRHVDVYSTSKDEGLSRDVGAHLSHDLNAKILIA
jgi:hypothetical protein